MRRHTLPVFLCAGNKPAMVVGGGQVALRKVQWLLKAEVSVEVLAPLFCAAVSTLAMDNAVTLRQEEYADQELKNFLLVIAATDNPGINRKVAGDAVRAGIPVNVVDCPELCTFFVPAMVARGPLKIALGTDGMCPALAARLRADLEGEYPACYADYVRVVGEIRQDMKGANLSSEIIGRVMKLLVSADVARQVMDLPFDKQRAALRRIIDNKISQEEKYYV